ncbi:O-methyltransferase [Streptococcus pneumoniae]|nr:O-methyltransferase [Streptococcus pneumoniae]
MVESYSKNANHNMRRPVVKEEIVENWDGYRFFSSLDG